MDKKPERLVPEVRFKGFTDDWEQRKLGTLFQKNIERNDDEKFNYNQTLSVSTMTFKPNGNGASAKSLANYKVLRLGDVAFEGHPNKQFSYGRFVVNDNADGIMSPRFATIRPIKAININYWKNYLHNENIMKYVLVKSTKAGTMMNELVYSDLYKQVLKVPNITEQVKIGNLLQKIEIIITLQQRKLEQLKQLKKALLQQLFVGKNNKQPNLRFKNFDGEWEQCMLKEIKDVRDGTHNSPKYQKEGYPLVTSKNLITNGIDLSNVSFISKYDYQEINKRSKVETGDILFGMIGTIGNHVMVKKGGFAIKNVALIKNGGEVSNGFLLHLLKSAIFSQYIKKENAGGTQKFLGLSVIRGFKFKVPDKVEQGNIASIFDTLNRFITLQKNNLTQLTTLKKYLLQNLFI